MKYFSWLLFLILPSYVYASEPTLTKELESKAKDSAKKVPPETAKIMADSLADLKKSGILDRAIKVGSTLPPFELPNATGKILKSKDLLAAGPLILTFYRGSWCPYCNIQLRAYQLAIPEFMKRGATLVAVTPANPDDTMTTSEKHKLQFEVLNDSKNTYAKKLGIVFNVTEPLKKVYQGFGIDLVKNQGNDSWELPVPATYIVNKSGVVKWAFVNLDYKKRADPKDILKALDSKELSLK